MPFFKHSPFDLDRPGLRLLRLLKGKGGLVECELFQAWIDGNEDEQMPYEALSYTWGGVLISEFIRIDGKTHAVTGNLFSALRHLRYLDEDRILWIDALCIDQDNLQERGHQVALMGDIYSRAERVLIWLGPGTNNTDLLLGCLKQLEIESTSDWTFRDSRWRESWFSLQVGMMSQHCDIAKRHLAGLELLLERNWFKRVWILQEVANAKRATVYSGTKSVSARVFAIAPTLVNVHVEDHCQAVLDIMPGLSREFSWWSEKRDLGTLLLKFGASEATDQRDKIYAMFGISSEPQRRRLRENEFASRKVPEYAPGIFSNTKHYRADYTKGLSEVIEDTARSLFNKPGVLEENRFSDLLDYIRVWNSASFATVVQYTNRDRVTEYDRKEGNQCAITMELIQMATMNKFWAKEVIAYLFEQDTRIRLRCRTPRTAIIIQTWGVLSTARRFADYPKPPEIVVAKTSTDYTFRSLELTQNKFQVATIAMATITQAMHVPGRAEESGFSWNTSVLLVEKFGGTDKIINKRLEFNDPDVKTIKAISSLALNLNDQELDERSKIVPIEVWGEDMVNIVFVKQKHKDPGLDQIQGRTIINQTMIEIAVEHVFWGWKLLAFVLEQQSNAVALDETALPYLQRIVRVLSFIHTQRNQDDAVEVCEREWNSLGKDFSIERCSSWCSQTSKVIGHFFNRPRMLQDTYKGWQSVFSSLDGGGVSRI
jgi:hypothetical protein